MTAARSGVPSGTPTSSPDREVRSSSSAGGAFTPEDNDISRSLAKQEDAKLADLKGLQGKAFDKAYAANEVAYHKQVNAGLKDTLIPAAQNAELRSLLQTGLKIFEGHEQHAEMMAKELR